MKLMKHARHTPWKTGQTVGLRQFVLDNNGNKIAKIESFGNDAYKQGELIAAAPELLEALLHVYEGYGHKLSDGCNQIIKQAIAKARGES